MYQIGDIGAGSGSGTAALALDGPFGRPAPRQPFGQRLDDIRTRTGRFDLVVDLGQRIGSRTWLRGFATCFALCYGAWSLWLPAVPLILFLQLPACPLGTRVAAATFAPRSSAQLLVS